MFKALRDQPTDEFDGGRQQHSRPLPQKISTSSESWSGPPLNNTSLTAVPERKKHSLVLQYNSDELFNNISLSAPTFGNHGSEHRLPAKSSIDSAPNVKGVEQQCPSKDSFKVKGNFYKKYYGILG